MSLKPCTSEALWDLISLQFASFHLMVSPGKSTTCYKSCVDFYYSLRFVFSKSRAYPVILAMHYKAV